MENEIQKSVPVHFRLIKETRNFLKYAVVDANGQPADFGVALVAGTIYVRKDGLDGKPKYLTAPLTVVE